MHFSKDTGSKDFESTSLNCCAYILAHGGNLVDAYQANGRVVFCLRPNDNQNLEKLAENFFTGDDNVSAKSFLRALDTLRDTLRIAKSKNGDILK